MMDIRILDGQVLNPSDLSWAGFSLLGKVTVYPTTAKEEILERCRDAEIVITNKVPFDRATMEALPKLRYIGITATGYNIIDVKAATELGITVTNVPEYSTEGVAESVFAHILAFTHRVVEHADMVRNGAWKDSGLFSFSAYPLMEIYGKRIGVIGMGHIGMRVAQIASAFGMEVVYYSRSEKKAAEEKGFTPLSLEELISTSDYITLHVPQTEETARMINKERIALMKPSAILINTARGGLIDEEALAEALNEKRIAGAGVDVLAEEPPIHGSPLISCPDCMITPHIAWAAKETRERLMAKAEENLASFLKGNPINVVSR